MQVSHASHGSAENDDEADASVSAAERREV